MESIASLRSENSTTGKAEEHNILIAAAILMINNQWDLGLQIPNVQDSPSRRREQNQTIEGRCVRQMVFLYFKHQLTAATTKFQEEADIRYQRWVRKPKAERGLLPKVQRNRRCPVTPSEKVELLKCLFEILKDECQKVPPTPSFNRMREDFDDRPIESKLPQSSRANKRSSGEHFEDIETSSKKQKQPEVPSKAQQQTSTNTSMPPPGPRRKIQDLHETSFISEASSVFSAPPSLRNFDSNNTQTTIPDDESEIATQPNSRPSSPIIGQPPSSDYGGSVYDQHIRDSFDANGFLIDDDNDAAPLPVTGHISKESFDSGVENIGIDPELDVPELDILYDGLKGIFPTLASELQSLPMPVLFELTRVCVHADVPISTFGNIKSLDLNDYNSFWSYLKNHPSLKGKPFPEKCTEKVWNVALADSSHGNLSIIFTGSLAYNNTPGTLFRFRLEPMKLDKSHRLSRRLGNDRFFELDMPHMSGDKIPTILKNLGDKGRRKIISWLVDGVHELFGRTWKPFHVKPKERRGRKWEKNRIVEEFNTGHRVYFFAVSGYGFDAIFNPLRESKNARRYKTMSIDKLLDCVRPTRNNSDGSYLKLFARTDLAVSRTTPTITLIKSHDAERSQIFYEKDITVDKEVMTDGAGQISPKFALAVTQALGLTFVPSGFQARIGEAKGFWSVDYHDKSEKIWITIYDSQRKWNPSLEGGEANHESHRTFEVLRWSAPLKAADLNLQFLPLLQQRAINRRLMERTLTALPEEALQRKLLRMQNGMSSPQSFRALLREGSSSVGERAKNGCVSYRAGLPTTIEERLVLLLDAGFDPAKLAFMSDLSQKVFKARCEELQNRLNITISKSTYAYMVPDFSGVLEPDEVYLDFSRFTDESSESPDASILLNGVDILVARSPAHYESDIQKVRAVHKVELMGLKDVIVFSTKGNLAAKLSGGDYDGDMAWICWESSIVDNFQNANVPEVPDLVKEGLIGKDSTTYKELVKHQSNPTSAFLNASFMFNMQQPMLGLCTTFKENFCYMIGTVSSKEAVYLCTLLSYLVDQAKQGYIFTPEHWKHFRTSKAVETTTLPSYKSNYINRRSEHIIDRLQIALETIIKKALTEFHQHVKRGTNWDSDLVKFYECVKEMAKGEAGQEGPKELATILDHLDSDIKQFKIELLNSYSGSEDDGKDDFMAKIDLFYPKLRAILPRTAQTHSATPLTQLLLLSFLPEESSSWALLRASAFFASYRQRRNPSRLVWNLVGKQLATLKALSGETGDPHYVVPAMYAMLRPDAMYVKKMNVLKDAGDVDFEENSSVVNADEIANFED